MPILFLIFEFFISNLESLKRRPTDALTAKFYSIVQLSKIISAEEVAKNTLPSYAILPKKIEL